MRDRNKSQDLMKAFRESRQQIQNTYEKPKPQRKRRVETFSRGYSNVPKANDPYSQFLDKYNHLAATIDSFKTQDLMYYFREKAKESGVKYVIANTKRDMAIFKKIRENYSPREICLMIEFIFFSDQDYLDPASTQPTVLASSWCNTLYRDSLLWADDQYVPKSKMTRRNSSVSKREWKRDVPQNDGEVQIGVWDE